MPNCVSPKKEFLKKRKNVCLAIVLLGYNALSQIFAQREYRKADFNYLYLNRRSKHMSTKYESPELKEFGAFQELTQLTLVDGPSDSPAAINSINSPQGSFTTTVPGSVEK